MYNNDFFYIDFIFVVFIPIAILNNINSLYNICQYFTELSRDLKINYTKKQRFQGHIHIKSLKPLV